MKEAAHGRSGRALTHAIEASGSSKAACARSCGCDAAIIADICDGLRPLTWERIILLPNSVQRALLEHRLTEVDEAAPVSMQAPHRHVIRLSRLVGQHAAVVEAAEFDGVVTPEELEEIERALVPITDASMLARRDVRAGRVT